MRVTAADIRAKYPESIETTISARRDTGSCYCVGGAVALFAGVTLCGFPHNWLIQDALNKLNPFALTTIIEANDIIRANNVGDFELAWQIVDKILARGIDEPQKVC